MLLINVMDLVGTVAFTVSGVLVGVKNKLDLLGILFLAIITASGGGLIRDVFLREDLPIFFTDPKYMIVILLSTVVTCIAFQSIRRILFVIKVFDAIGLGVFTVLTAYRAQQASMPLIGVLFVATITGVGGGILRDILVNEVPLVFRSEIYALASIAGAFTFYLLSSLVNPDLNIYLCIGIVFLIRIISIHLNLNLPTIKSTCEEYTEEQQKTRG
ncbi:MAG: hypothetical protein K0R31_479 [Clostridiales bacterium]|jgi:uncharacterized membrane protein YeiH|nr:hypothetical protein [Clostridiales bacterium]